MILQNSPSQELLSYFKEGETENQGEGHKLLRGRVGLEPWLGWSSSRIGRLE